MRWRLEGSGWRLAWGLIALAKEINEVWPDRHPADGTIGDAAHRTRRSDHNPWDVEVLGDDIVMALDVGETVEGQGQTLVDALVESRDSRIRYIIHENRIWRSYDKPGIPAWTPGQYTGTNGHLDHVHISLDRGSAWDWNKPWNLNLSGEQEEDMEFIKTVQRALVAAGWDIGSSGVDGVAGPDTEAALTGAFKQLVLEHTHTATVELT